MDFLEDMIEHRRARVRAELGSLTRVERDRLVRCGRESHPYEDLLLLRDRDDVGVIAEVKKASPSEGPIAPGCSAATQARRYKAGGAAAISVLTEPDYFGGSFADLSDVVDAVEIPVLCKDVIVDPAQLYMARASGAGAVLLMVSVLQGDLPEYMDLAASLGLGRVVEVADLDELDLACRFGASVVAVNARNLRCLHVDTAGQLEIVSEAASCCDLFVIAASGIKTRADVQAAADAGADAVLVGTSLMRASSPEEAVRALTGVPKRSKR